MAKAKEEESGGRVVRTLHEVANHFGVNTDTCRSWRKRRVPMPGSTGAYDLDEIEAWRDSTFAKTSGPGGDQNGGGIVLGSEAQKAREQAIIADAQKKMAQARIANLAATRAEDATLLSRAEVDAAFSQLFLENRRLLYRIPQQMKGGYPDSLRKRLVTELEHRIDTALRALKSFAEDLFDVV